MSAHLFALTEQLNSHWTAVQKSKHLIIFRKSLEKIQVSLKSDKNIKYIT
jgi:hypothetical protein